MTTFTSPELVSAVLSERRREAAERGVSRAARIARACCETASRGLRTLFTRRAPTSC